jgi:four helix bundle protein
MSSLGGKSGEAIPDDRDPLTRMRAYRLACELIRDSWQDADELRQHRAAERVSSQLYRAVGSVAANLAEGYSHSSGRDRARIFEYALGSAREATAWYHTAEPVLGGERVATRLSKLTEIRRLLLAIIPRERGRLIRPRRPSNLDP